MKRRINTKSNRTLMCSWCRNPSLGYCENETCKELNSLSKKYMETKNEVYNLSINMKLRELRNRY